MENRHPVDQLAEVRAGIKVLQERESVLKARIVDALADRPQRGETQRIDGDDFMASVSLVERETVDREEVKKLLGKRFERCLKKSSSLNIRLSPRARLEEAA